MSVRYSGRSAAIGASLFILAVIAGVLLIRTLTLPEAGAQQQNPPIPQCMSYQTPSGDVLESCFDGTPPESGWYGPLLEAEREQPFFDGMLAGLRIGPEVEGSDAFCRSIGAADREARSVIEIERTFGTAVEISPAYLPHGSEAVRSLAAQCGSIAYSSEVEYWVPPDLSIPRWGGAIWIHRVRGETNLGLALAANRAEAGEVAGHPAALFRPLTPEGFGYSAIAYSDGEVLTFLLGTGVSIHDLRKVAESLGEGGAQ